MVERLTIKVREITNREKILIIGKDITQELANELHNIALEHTHCEEGSEEYNTLKEYVGSDNGVECGYTQIEVFTVESEL